LKFTPLPLSGAFLIEQERRHDERGFFSRTFCEKEFSSHGLVTSWVQMSTSFNSHKGQIRGMHYQEEPYAETKLVRCTAGSIYDIMLDLRKDSPTYQQWYGDVLSNKNGKMFYIPKGFAHGYQTLEENTELFYMMDQIYIQESAKELNVEERYFARS
jgi:dTDP-4-dehydrorhamnose 3,5-epimerase